MSALKKISELSKEEEMLLSRHQIENAKEFFYVLHSGRQYVIPVNKDMKKIINKVGLYNFEGVIRFVIDAIYLQVRQRVGDNIELMLSQQIDEGLRKLYTQKLRKDIDGKFNLLEFNDNVIIEK